MTKTVALGIAAAVMLVALLVTGTAHAAEDAAVALSDRDKWLGVAATVGLAVAAFGGALGQGRAAATALEGIARNPGAASKLFTPMIISLVLIESLVIYSLVAFFTIYVKLH
jgi:F-type H+-transporting ATPase subunit c